MGGRRLQASHGWKPPKMPLYGKACFIQLVCVGVTILTWTPQNHGSVWITSWWSWRQLRNISWSPVGLNLLHSEHLPLGAQVRKGWEACTRWWHLMVASCRRPAPPSPMVCWPEHRAIQRRKKISPSQTETSLLSFQKIWVLLSYQPISTSSTFPTFWTHVPATLLLNYPKTVLVWMPVSCSAGVFTSLRKPCAMHFFFEIT